MAAKEPRIADTSALKHNDTHSSQTIDSFLAKPIVVNVFDWNTSQATNTSLMDLNLDAAMSMNPMWFRKTAGFGLMRATIILKVQLNASPMNAGGLLISHRPGYSTVPQTYDNRRTMISRSQLPSVVMDVCQHELEFEVPYVAPVRFYDLSGQFDTWGNVTVHVYSPLTNGSTGSAQATGTIWMSFKDVELSNPIVGQMGRGTFRAKPKNPSGAELPPVSSFLASASKVASSLASLPTLASVAGPVAWFTSLASGAAASFGWSKPNLQTTGERVLPGAHYGSQNVHCVDNSQQLAPCIDNSLRVLDDIGRSDVDEMSINFVKTQWSYITSFDWSTSVDLGSPLWTAALAPLSLPDDALAVTAGDYKFTRRSYTPVGLLGRLFQQYRGGFCLRFRIFKTNMHTGRLAVAFLPTQDANASLFPPFGDTDYLLREIIDVTDGNEICLEFPYMHQESYVRTNIPIGKVMVYVVNALRCPEVVSSTVNVVVEVRGLDDMEFQMPVQSKLQPIIGQMGTNLESNDNTLIKDPIGDAESKTMSGLSQYTTGEQLGSLLQLLKRYYRLQGQRIAAFLQGDSFRRRRFNPFLTSPFALNSGVFDYPEIGGDYLTMFSSFYLFSRGGLRIRFISDGTPRNVASWIDVPAKTNTADTSIIANWDPSLEISLDIQENAGVSPCINSTIYGGFSVQCPAYSNKFTNYTRVCTTARVPQPPYSLTYESIGKLADVATDDTKMHLYRACADDFQLSYWLGIPDLIEDVVYTP